MPSDVKRIPEELLATYEITGEACAQIKHLFVREQKTQDMYFNLQSTLLCYWLMNFFKDTCEKRKPVINIHANWGLSFSTPNPHVYAVCVKSS